MAEQGPLSINVNLNTNAPQAAQQVDQFNQALGRVNQQSRRIFASLQELSQRYQQQGFLGASDQRMLEQGVRQWERMSQVLDLRRRGAEGRLQDAKAKGGEGAGMRVVQAQETLERLTLHQQGLSTLRGAVRDVLGAPFFPPAPATPQWYPGRGPGAPFPLYPSAAGPGAATRGQFYGPGLGPEDMRGYPSAAERGRPTRGRVFGPGLGPDDMRGYESAARPGRPTRGRVFGPGLGPDDFSGYASAARRGRATGGRFFGPGFGPDEGDEGGPAAGPGRPTRGRFFGPGFGPGDMGGYESAARPGRPTRGRFYGPGFGPDEGGDDGGGGGFFGTLAAMSAGGGKLLGRIGGPLRAIGGLAVGYTAIQMLSQAMQAYEDRQLGILRVGRELDEQYSTIGDTLTALRRDYFLTAREGVAAMSVLGRVTGNAEDAAMAVLGTSQVARAYGMDPVAAAQMQAQLTLTTPSGAPNPLALVGVYEQARTRGELIRMSYGRFAEEAVRVAGVGGFGTPLMGEREAGDVTRMMAAFGGRYAAHPGAAFAEYYGRQQASKSVLGEALNWQALADVMQSHPQGVPMEGAPGGMLQPGRSYIEQQVLMEEGARSPAYRASQFARAQRESGGNRDLAILLYKQMTNAPTTGQALREFTALEGQAAQPGGVAGAFQTTGATATGQAVVAGRERRPYQPGEDILRRRMTPEELAETGVVRLLEEARTEMLKTIQDTALAFNTSKDSADALGKIFGDLGGAADKLKSVFELMALIPGLGWVGLGGTAAISLGQGLEIIPAPAAATTQPRKAHP